MKQMSDVKESLGEYSDKLRVFLVSVDPDRDKPENLRQYLDNFDKNFKGLTGEIDQIYNSLPKLMLPFSQLLIAQNQTTQLTIQAV